MSADDALGVFSSLRREDIHCWIMGGWGVDALLSRARRQHHDLDLLVEVSALPRLELWLRTHSYQRLYSWPESRSFVLAERSWPTAFVAGDQDGRELDLHAVEVAADGTCALATDDPWVLPANALTGAGTISGQQVQCVSLAAQLAMHTGYALPTHHEEDLRALRKEAMGGG